MSVGAGGELGARILDGRERKQRGEGKRLVGCPCPLKQHSLGTGPLTLHIPSVLWSRSLMSWKFLCSSKGRFSIPGEKRRN